MALAFRSVTDSLIDITRETISEIASGADINTGPGQLNLIAASTTFGGSETSSTTVSAIDIAALSVDSIVDSTTRAGIQSGATVRASAGTLSVAAISDNHADAKIKSIGVGIGLTAGLSTPTANVRATTEASTSSPRKCCPAGIRGVTTSF